MADPDDLYQQFIEVFQQSGSLGLDRGEDGAMDKANLFEDLTDAHYRALMSFKSKRAMGRDGMDACKRLEVMLREERNTWRLARALLKDQLLVNNPESSRDEADNSNRMDDSNGRDSSFDIDLKPQQNGHMNSHEEYQALSEDQIIGNYYVTNDEIRRMQLVADWLEANESSDLVYKDEEDKVEFYAEGPTAWENTFHAMRASIIDIQIPNLDITMNPNAGLELCDAMDPDAPFRTNKSIAHQDKEIEIRLFKHLFRFIKAGKLDEGQDMAQRVGYHWLAAILEGWLPYSDPNLDQENLEKPALTQNGDIKPVSGNKRRDVWKNTCFKASRMQGLDSHEKAILGVLGGNIKSVLPVCHTWSDQLWARLKCSIDVKIEKALRDPNVVPEGSMNLMDLPQEFYDSYQNLENMFQSIANQKIVSPFKEATIHQTIQKFLVLGDIDGLINQLATWCSTLDYDMTEAAISPQFLRCFAHIVLFFREVGLIEEDDAQGSKIIETYIDLLTQHKSIESVAHYSGYLPKENQTLSFAKLLATISDREERRDCLRVAKGSKLDVDEITQTVVELIRDESPSTTFTPCSDTTKTTPFDRRKIDALDYLLLLDTKNYIAILHHGNILMRHFALMRKMDAVKETFLKLPVGLAKSVETQWRLHTNSDITPMLRNNLRELDAFKIILEAQEELSQWSEWHHKKPEEPRKPANLTKFCDNVNYEQRLKQYQQDMNVWRGLREVRTNALTDKISQIFYYADGWMRDVLQPGEDGDGTFYEEISGIHSQYNNTSAPPDLNESANAEAPNATRSKSRADQLAELRRHFIPYMISVCFNVLQLTNRYEDCLKLSHVLARDDLRLYDEFTKAQLREFLDKISEVTKLMIKQSISES